jgi:hypothetical protein
MFSIRIIPQMTKHLSLGLRKAALVQNGNCGKNCKGDFDGAVAR